MKPHALDPPHPQGRESPFVLEASEAALHSRAASVEALPAQRLPGNQRVQRVGLDPHGRGLALPGGAAPLRCFALVVCFGDRATVVPPVPNRPLRLLDHPFLARLQTALFVGTVLVPALALLGAGLIVVVIAVATAVAWPLLIAPTVALFLILWWLFGLVYRRMRPRLGVPVAAALEVSPLDGTRAGPMDRRRAITRGDDLLRGIEAEQITFSAAPWNMATGMLLRNRTAEVERWATAAGSTRAVPTAPDGRPTEMDYAQLIAYVKEVIDAMENQWTPRPALRRGAPRA